MRNARHSFIFVIFLSIFVSGCGKSEAPVDDILSELDSLEQKLAWVDYRLTEEKWEYYRNGQSDSLSFYNDLYLYLISGSEIYKFGSNAGNISDRTDRQRLQIIIAETLPDRIESRPAQVVTKDSLNIIDTFKVDFQGQVKSLADAKDICESSRSRSQRELGCRAFYSVGENLSAGVARLIISRNETAVRLGFENYWELVSSQFSQNGVDLLQFIRAVDSLTQSANSKFFENSRKDLGVNKLELWDMAFAHSQIDRQGDSFFPIDSQETLVRRALKSVGFNLEQLPIYFDRVHEITTDFDAAIFDVRPPHDIRLLSNSRNGYAGTLARLRQTGSALYSAFIAQERPLYNYAADPTWQLAMGEIIAAIAHDSAWLVESVNMPVGFIAQFRIAQLEQETFNIRLLLTNISFVYEAHLNPNRDLNQLYWELYQKYTGLPRHDDIIIWSTVPELISDPMILVRQLLAKTIAAQSVNYMTSYFGPLTNNHNTSSFLVQNYFRFGSRYGWPELLQRGTGEKLTPLHLKKHFES